MDWLFRCPVGIIADTFVMIPSPPVLLLWDNSPSNYTTVLPWDGAHSGRRLCFMLPDPQPQLLTVLTFPLLELYPALFTDKLPGVLLNHKSAVACIHVSI